VKTIVAATINKEISPQADEIAKQGFVVIISVNYS
jgi:hypothetical protein